MASGFDNRALRIGSFFFKGTYVTTLQKSPNKMASGFNNRALRIESFYHRNLRNNASKTTYQNDFRF